ncbi:hypothetical protein CYMTET_51520, partial [Cymbomonas tetramitiformis]
FGVLFENYRGTPVAMSRASGFFLEQSKQVAAERQFTRRILGKVLREIFPRGRRKRISAASNEASLSSAGFRMAGPARDYGHPPVGVYYYVLRMFGRVMAAVVLGVFTKPCACEEGEIGEQLVMCTWPQSAILLIGFVSQLSFLIAHVPFDSHMQQYVATLTCLCNAWIIGSVQLAWHLDPGSALRETLSSSLFTVQCISLFGQVIGTMQAFTVAIYLVVYQHFFVRSGNPTVELKDEEVGSSDASAPSPPPPPPPPPMDEEKVSSTHSLVGWRSKLQVLKALHRKVKKVPVTENLVR